MKKLLIIVLLCAISATTISAQTTLVEGTVPLLIDHTKRTVTFTFPDGIAGKEEITFIGKSGARLQTIALNNEMLREKGYTIGFDYLESLGAPSVELSKNGNAYHTFTLADEQEPEKATLPKPETQTILGYSEANEEVTVGNRTDIKPGSVIEVYTEEAKLLASTTVPETALGTETFVVKTPGLASGLYLVKVDNRLIGTLEKSTN